MKAVATVVAAVYGLFHQLMHMQVFFVKVGFFLCFVYSLNCQLVAADSDIGYEQVARQLHSELRYTESEIMRLWVTIDALQDQMHQNPDAISAQMNQDLADLYFYESHLSEYLGALKIQLGVLEDPSGMVFAKEQFDPIHLSNTGKNIPRGAIVVPDAHNIKFHKAGF